MARDFNGSSDYIDRPAGPVSTAINNFTFCCFVNLDVKISQEIVMNGYSGGSGVGYELRFSNSSQRFQFDAAFVAAITGTTNPNTGQWYHILGKIEGGTAYLFINGISEGTPASITPFTPANYFAIGARRTDVGGVSGFTDGRICEVGFWNRALTSAEILSLANGYAPSFFPENLVFYSQLSGQDTPERDVKSSNILTMNGTLKSAHPDFMKYPIGPYVMTQSLNGGDKLRPRPFAPGMAR